MKLRIKEEKYESGISKFFPQIYGENGWKTMNMMSIRFNDKGLQWCETLKEAQSFIKKFKDAMELLNLTDKVVEEKIYDVS